MSISKVEREAVLNLFPYFDKKHSVVFDVGSNKGDFAELFVDRVDEVHLFEPNEILLHYSMVRFCDRSNIQYSKDALSNISGTADFTFFINENNGLSNIINNKKWDYLPGKKKKINCSTLDVYCKSGGIDLLKIDVEGAELMVLQGAKNILKEHRVKFIQVEKAEHIEATGKTFQDIVDYLESFGYTPLETDDTENVIFAVSGFTQNWNSEFINNTAEIPKFIFGLEIGSFEGLTSCYICDNLLLPEGRIICVDPLEDYYIEEVNDPETDKIFQGQYGRFIRNTKGKPIELIRKKSIDAWSNELKDYRFDFIYIDGDHRKEQVFTDGVKGFEILKEGGYMLFDDYDGYSEETKKGIDNFLETQTGNFYIIKKGYQILIQKKDWTKINAK